MEIFNREFFKSYIITQYAVDNEKCQHKIIKDFHVYIDNSLEVSEYSKEYHWILIGYAVDHHAIDYTCMDILEQLDRCTNEDEIHTILNRLNGRFLIITDRQHELKIYPDATTMRPLFYHANLPLAASHSSLLAMICENIYREKLKKYNSKINGALDLSMYEDCFKLNPNCSLTLPSMKQQRFFPGCALEKKKLTDVTAATISIFDQYKKWLKSRKTFLTLTAGSDSRVSLAVMHNTTIPTLTYTSNHAGLSQFAKKTYSTDEKWVKEIAEDLKLNQVFYSLSENKVNDQYSKYLRAQTESSHSFLLSEYLANSKFKDYTHIKSTIFELAKLAYKKEKYKKDLTAFKEFLYEKISDNLLLNYPNLIEEYLIRNNINEISVKNHDFLDVYYQESRMGNWHSNITQETDNSVEIFVFMNSRELITLAASLSIDTREKQNFHKELINHYWPVLNFYPVNSDINLYDAFKEQFLLFDEGFNIRGESFDIKTNMIVPIFPLRTLENHMTISNNTEEPIYIKLFSQYSNANGRGLLSLKINAAFHDFLDINSGITIELAGQQSKTITVIYSKYFDKPSWQKAGTLYFKRVGEV